MFNIFKSFFLITLFSTLYAQNLQELKTFQSDFKQTIINPSNNEAIYTGTIDIKEPNFIKWHYETPIEKLVYIKKYTVTIIEPELEQAIITRLNKEINILTLLKSAKKIDQNIYESNFNNVKYTLLFKNNLLNTISYTDELENKVIIAFSNTKQNKSLSDETFKFQIPQEFDIIRK